MHLLANYKWVTEPVPVVLFLCALHLEELVDDAVGEAYGGGDDVVGFGGFGDHEEELGGGDDDVGTVLAEFVLLHTLFYGEWCEVGVEFVEGGYGEAVCAPLALGG